METNVISNDVQNLDARTFPETIQHGIVLVAFYEPWCAPWRLEQVRLEHLASRVGTHLTVGAVNIDKEPELAERFRVQCIPTLLLFKDGQLIQQFAGVLRESIVVKAVKAAAAD
jgi:thioredoxin 1